MQQNILVSPSLMYIIIKVIIVIPFIKGFKKFLIVYVTGYWKTDHNVTLGQLHFIGPANSHTHALSMH